MIQGRSNLVYRITDTNKYVSAGLIHEHTVTPIHIDISLVENDVLNIESLKKWKSDFKDAEFILEDGKYICGWQGEKMSKRYYNTVDPEEICEKYGADTFRLYEMFLGPLEMGKPFILNGIEGVFRFLKKAYNLFENEKNEWLVNEALATPAELKILHQTIKKVGEDIEKLSFNTSVSQFMICVNAFQDFKCSKRAVFEPFLIVLSPFAPHFCEEMWMRMGHTESISKASWPQWDEAFMTESNFEYPIAVNGKVKGKINLPLELKKEEVELELMKWPELGKATGDAALKKVIVVHGRIINVVI